MTDAPLLDAELSQAMDAAVAAYQRRFGRHRTIERLEHMLERAREAQRVMDEATERVAGAKSRAAE